MAANIKIDEKNKKVTIELPLFDMPVDHPNTVSIAETRNESTGVTHNGKPIKVSVQVYFKKPTA